MDIERLLYPVLSRKYRTLIFFTFLGILPRLVVMYYIPMDWNSDSFHHWQISYLSLKLGFPQFRLWDLNGCEYYWGVIPHIVQALLLWLFSTASMQPYRIFNMLLGGFNVYIVYLIGRDHYYWKVGFIAALLYSIYPPAMVFDVTGMQETLALFFALSAVYMYRHNPGWGGLMLALACQSRVEYWLVSLIFIVSAVLVERMSSRVQAFTISWFGVMLIFSILFKVWTTNPVYPLYWSLFSVFGGWTMNRENLPFYLLMISWLSIKVNAWLTKPTGLLIIGSALAMGGYFIKSLREKPLSYHIPLFFLSSTVIFSPLFITYFPSYPDLFLYMFRMSIPLAAFGFNVLIHKILVWKADPHFAFIGRIPISALLLVLVLVSNCYIVPAYSGFQVVTSADFEVADFAAEYYAGGVVICDDPTMNYRFVEEHGFNASNLLSNHYSPHGYGLTDAFSYASWFYTHNITLWMFTGGRSEPVWRDIFDTGIFLYKGELNGCRIYGVNSTMVHLILEPQH